MSLYGRRRCLTSAAGRVGDALLGEARLGGPGQLLLLRGSIAGCFRVPLAFSRKALQGSPSKLFLRLLAWDLQVVAVCAEALNVKSDRTTRTIALIVTSSAARGQANHRPILGPSKRDHAAAPHGGGAVTTWHRCDTPLPADS